jgi:hypothetical protein
MQVNTVHHVEEAIAATKQQLLQHPLYQHIQNLDDLKVFLHYHVYAVWDFMSLLKALQQKLTCTTTPWVPVGNPKVRYLINEIVLAEETDVDALGNRKSHYELYIDAMQACGANTQAIEQLVAQFGNGATWEEVSKSIKLPEAVCNFLNFTFQVIQQGKPHEIAAAFTFGREDLIPGMFTEILHHFQNQLNETSLDKLIYYFERHIELDGDEHGPMAMLMIEELCEGNEQKWNEVAAISEQALQMRIQLWDAMLQHIQLSKQFSVN